MQAHERNTFRAVFGAVFLGSLILSPYLEAPESQEPRPTDATPRREEGRRLAQDFNCGACHNVGSGTEPKLPGNFPAPDLSHIGDKVRAEWLFTFLRQPTTLRPWLKARMPSFSFTDEEALAVAEYMMTLKDSAAQSPGLNLQAREIGSPGYINAGSRLASKDYFDCLSCHQQGDKKPEGPPEQWAPDLALASQRLKPDWVIRWLKEPQKIQPGTAMPSYFADANSGPDEILGGDEERQILALTAYVMSLGDRQKVRHNDDAYREVRYKFAAMGAEYGKRLVNDMTCAGCHKIAGTASALVGPDLTREGSRVTREWLAEFLRDPSPIRLQSLHRMPNFLLSNNEAEALASYISEELVDKNIPAEPPLKDQNPTSLIAEGKRLLDQELGCRTCHRIGGVGALGGPDLTHAKNRLRPAWVFEWIKDPKHFDPQTLMPKVTLADEEAKAITAFLMYAGSDRR